MINMDIGMEQGRAWGGRDAEEKKRPDWDKTKEDWSVLAFVLTDFDSPFKYCGFP